MGSNLPLPLHVQCDLHLLFSLLCLGTSAMPQIIDCELKIYLTKICFQLLQFGPITIHGRCTPRILQSRHTFPHPEIVVSHRYFFPNFDSLVIIFAQANIVSSKPETILYKRLILSDSKAWSPLSYPRKSDRNSLCNYKASVSRGVHRPVTVVLEKLHLRPWCGRPDPNRGATVRF